MNCLKKVKCLFIVLILISSSLEAQYRVNKLKYDPETYTPRLGDKYNPTLAGIESAFIPGFGQILSGEPLRGGVFLGSFILVLSGAHLIAEKVNPPQSYIYAITTVFVSSGLWIASIIDAVIVAKVNNLAFRDQHDSAFKLEVKPYLNSTINRYNFQPNGGLILSLKF